MLLLDHFRPQLHPQRHWESFHVNWAGAIADALNEDLLPEGYFAEEHAHIGARVWKPSAPAMVVPAVFPDSFEVLVFQSKGGANLVAAIELVSPSNKDRPEHRRAFAVKCGSYLAQGIALIVIDIVTSRQANLHNEMMQVLGHGSAFELTAGCELYAVAYRPMVADEKQQIHVWPEALAVGRELPTLPLALSAEICLPLNLGATYAAACQRRRIG
jgi:Protein of unknown function (DUF4058)